MPKYTYGVAAYQAVVCNLRTGRRFLKPGHESLATIYAPIDSALIAAGLSVLPHTSGEQKNRFTVSAPTLDDLTTALDQIRGTFGG